MTRERELKDKRALKQEKKDSKKLAAALAATEQPAVDEVEGDQGPADVTAGTNTTI